MLRFNCISPKCQQLKSRPPESGIGVSTVGWLDDVWVTQLHVSNRRSFLHWTTSTQAKTIRMKACCLLSSQGWWRWRCTNYRLKQYFCCFLFLFIFSWNKWFQLPTSEWLHNLILVSDTQQVMWTVSNVIFFGKSIWENIW